LFNLLIANSLVASWALKPIVLVNSVNWTTSCSLNLSEVPNSAFISCNPLSKVLNAKLLSVNLPDTLPRLSPNASACLTEIPNCWAVSVCCLFKALNVSNNERRVRPKVMAPKTLSKTFLRSSSCSFFCCCIKLTPCFSLLFPSW
jgi:hypothetical protein